MPRLSSRIPFKISASGYGVHLVYVHDLEEAPVPAFAAVEERVKQEWLDERRRELRDEYVNEVLTSYEVVFEDLPPEEHGQAEQRAEARPKTNE